MDNRIGRNRPSSSPEKERKYNDEYKRQNPAANKKGDNKDVAAVKNESGTKGHALMNEKYNRSHDTKPHKIEGFIPDSKLKKKM